MIRDTLEPVLIACVLNQTRAYWLISDAVEKVTKLYLKYQALESTLQMVDHEDSLFSDFPSQLKECQRRMRTVLMKNLKTIISPLLAYEGTLEWTTHYFLAMALDPEFKGLHRPFMKRHVQDAQNARPVVRMYDNEHILLALVYLYNTFIRAGRQSYVDTRTETVVANDETEKRIDLQNRDSIVSAVKEGNTGGKDTVPECFIINENENDYGRSLQIVTEELNAYRRELYDGKAMDKFQWLREKRNKFPTLILLAQHILGIPPTQIENEGIFSIAGKIATPLRSRIKIENLENLLCVSKNFRVPERLTVKPRCRAEFSDSLIQAVEKIVDDVTEE